MLVHTLLFIFDLVGFMVLKEMDIQLFFFLIRVVELIMTDSPSAIKLDRIK